MEHVLFEPFAMWYAELLKNGLQDSPINKPIKKANKNEKPVKVGRASEIKRCAV
jgi:hypothetical protein